MAVKPISKKEDINIPYTPIQYAVQKDKEKGKNMLLPMVVGAIVIVALGIVCVRQFFDMRELKSDERAAAEAAQEARDMKEEVGQLMQLPEEAATVATVQDVSKLNGQEFFKDAQNGDKVLIFTEAKKAILYRQSTHKIINSGPIMINSGTSAANTGTGVATGSAGAVEE